MTSTPPGYKCELLFFLKLDQIHYRENFWQKGKKIKLKVEINTLAERGRNLIIYVNFMIYMYVCKIIN